MKRRLPPLNSLRAFEAAARLGSMSLAAEELNVTQAAVSKQVKSLEQFLRKALFLRSVRKITLTEDGERYSRSLARILDDLESSTTEVEVGGRTNHQAVKFSSYYGYNIQWLLPRMAELRDTHPNLEVRLSSSVGESIDFARDAVDCAVRTGLGHWTDCDFERIVSIQWRPVCSPALLRGGRLRQPRDLAHYSLLRSAGSPGIWHEWLQTVGEPVDVSSSVIEFDQGALCYEAAIHGVGVAVADCMLVKRHVEAGQLCYPFEHAYVDPRSYYFLSRKTLQPKGMTQFKAWLIKQMRADSPHENRVS